VYVFIVFAPSCAATGRADWSGKSGSFPQAQEAFKMKMLILLIVLALVATVVLWRVRKTDAERELVRLKAMKLKQKESKEAIVPENHVTWPVIIKPGGKSPVKESEELPEPSMTTIEFEPVDHPSLQH
jgi:hypothetical protein